MEFRPGVDLEMTTHMRQARLLDKYKGYPCTDRTAAMAESEIYHSLCQDYGCSDFNFEPVVCIDKDTGVLGAWLRRL